MFAVGDLVQPRAGGPKLKVVEVQGEQLVVVQAAQEQGERYSLKSDEVTPQHRNYTSFSYRFVVSRHRQISPQKPLSSLKSPACFEKKHEPINSG